MTSANKNVTDLPHKQIMEYDLVIVETPLPHQPTLSCGLHKLYCGSLAF